MSNVKNEDCIYYPLDHPSNSGSLKDKRVPYLNSIGFSQALSTRDFYGSNGYDPMNTFNRYGVTYAGDEISSTLGYVFIVRPDLNIIESGSNANDIQLNTQALVTPEIQYAFRTFPELLLNLTQKTPIPHHFIPFLVDRVEEYQIPDVMISTHEMTQPFTGFKTVYAGNANGSLSGTDPQIRFRDTDDLRVTKLFQIWLGYINAVSMGIYTPREQYSKYKYKFNGGSQVIDYATSIYYIKTKPTGEIIFFHKTTGCIPSLVPTSTWSYNRGGQDEHSVTISFVGGYPEALNLYTVAEFNYNSLGHYGGNVSIKELAPDYNRNSPYSTSGTGDLFTGAPVILGERHGAKFKLWLCWKKISDITSGVGQELDGTKERRNPYTPIAFNYNNTYVHMQNTLYRFKKAGGIDGLVNALTGDNGYTNFLDVLSRATSLY